MIATFWAIIIFMGGLLLGIVIAVVALKSPDHTPSENC